MVGRIGGGLVLLPGDTSGWQLVALYKEAHPTPKSAKHVSNPDARPHLATGLHQVWFADVRYAVL